MSTSGDKQKRARKGRTKDSAARLARILDMIDEKPMTLREISEAIEVDKTTVRRYLFALLLAKHAHIEGWTTGHGRPAARYAAGEDQDAPAPVETEAAKEYDSHELESAINRANQRKAARIKPFRDPLIAALYGDAA